MSVTCNIILVKLLIRLTLYASYKLNLDELIHWLSRILSYRLIIVQFVVSIQHIVYKFMVPIFFYKNYDFKKMIFEIGVWGNVY